MKRFVEFSLHEYMDEYPTQHVRIMEGENLEAIEKASKETAENVSKLYSGGPTSFVKVWNKKEARECIDTNKAKIGEDSSDEDIEWLEFVEKAFYICYVVTLIELDSVIKSNRLQFFNSLYRCKPYIQIVRHRQSNR